MEGSVETFQVEVYPKTVWIQQNRHCQRLNHDFWIQSNRLDEWILQEVSILVYDQFENVVQRKRLDNQAHRPSIATLPERMIQPNGSLYLFNPFPEFDNYLPLHRLNYRLQFVSTTHELVVLKVDVFPQTYLQKANLTLPLQEGRILIDDGNDYFSHHRRVVIEHPLIQQLGMTRNDQRFAWDFVFVDDQGQDYHIDEKQLDHYYSFGKPIYSPGDGKVVSVRNDVPDNDPYNVVIASEEAQNDPSIISGNQVIIDHGNQEYSVLAHCMNESICVEVGDVVTTGDFIAKLGNSGWTAYPHLHYAVVDCSNLLHAEGLPIRFSKIALSAGDEPFHFSNDAPNTGEILVV
ncbi:MAG: M23 family metallopeptidase [Chloroflexota bacterium]